MRINSISNFNYNQRRNINFGKFMDDNARKVVKQALTDDYDATQWCYDGYFREIDECEYIEVYTDKDGIVKGRFSDEFTRSEDYKKVEFDINLLNSWKTLEDLSTTDNAEDLAMRIESMDKSLKGEDSTENKASDNSKLYGDYDSYAQMRAYGNDPWEIY